MTFEKHKAKEHQPGVGIRVFYRPAGIHQWCWVPWTLEIATANHLFRWRGK